MDLTCKKCDAFGKHPVCPLCTRTMHSIGYVSDKGTKYQELDKSAPTRVLTQQKDGIALAYMVPYFVAKEKIPGDKALDLVKRIVGLLYPNISVNGIASFKYGKLPYVIDVVDADLTGETMPFMKIRYGYWECKDHKASFPGDIPARVIQRDGGRCIICGSDKNIVVAYMIPLERNGVRAYANGPKASSRTEVGNLAVFCESCQRDRADMDYWQYVKTKGFPMNDFVINFSTGFVRSFVIGGKVRL